MEKLMSFSLRSGGRITVDLARCDQCEKKPCIQKCQEPGVQGPLTSGENGQLILKHSTEAIARGACIECMGCELVCHDIGMGALLITFNMPELESAILEMEQNGLKPVYKLTGGVV